MASRAFSITARQFKQLSWSLHGTTIDVNWLTRQIELSIDEVPGLKDRVVSAKVMYDTCVSPNRMNSSTNVDSGKSSPYA